MNINLDKIDFTRADPGKMRDHLLGFVDYCRNAWDIAADFALPSYFIKYRKIVFLGMGASGVAGEFLKDLLVNSAAIVECVHDYDLPAWVDKETLVIALCHSGNTEEVLYAFVSAYEKNARLLAITTGGKLESLCSKYRAPIIKYQINTEPKLAFPYLLIIPYVVLVKIGLLENRKDEFEKNLLNVSAQIKKISPDIHIAVNPAKDLAGRIFGLPMYIISSGNLRAAGIRFSNSINENAKNLCSYFFLPEMNHNLIAGLQNPREVISKSIFIFLESKFSRLEIKQRINVTTSVMNKKNIDYIRIDFLQASDKLSEILQSVVFADYVGMYLGFLNQADPTSARAVESFKDELNK